MDVARPELLKVLRTFAADPKALFMLVKSPHGRVPIWADDILLTNDDAELCELVTKCVAEYVGIDTH